MPLYYKDRRLDSAYRADFVCYEWVVVELKALRGLTETEAAQVINYLRSTGLEIGLLLNFGRESLEFRRLVLTRSAQSYESAQSVDVPGTELRRIDSL